MKKINKFFDVAPLWQVYLIMTVIFTVVFYFVFNSIFIVKVKPIVVVNISILTSLFISSMYLLLVFTTRKSEEFLKKVKEIENNIDECNTKDELQNLYKTEVRPLYDKIWTIGQSSELKRVISVMEMKYKLLEK